MQVKVLVDGFFFDSILIDVREVQVGDIDIDAITDDFIPLLFQLSNL